MFFLRLLLYLTYHTVISQIKSSTAAPQPVVFRLTI